MRFTEAMAIYILLTHPTGLGSKMMKTPEESSLIMESIGFRPVVIVSLLVDSLTLPNGIIFLPGEKKFIVANSDPAKAIWYEFELNDKDSVQQGRVFYNATSNAGTEKGLPDGLKADRDGNIFASGPGGIWIFNPDGYRFRKDKNTGSRCKLRLITR
jgi:sugar lactone lactonase YvrE